MKRIARVIIEERDVLVSGREQARGGGIEHFAGNPLRIETLFTRLDQIVNDPAVTAVAAAVLAEDFTGASLADAATGSIDASVTASDWNARAKENAALEFTGPQMELPIPDGQDSQRYVVVFYFDDYTFGWCYLTIRRDGVPASPAPVPNPDGTFIPPGATYDASGNYTLAVVTLQFYVVGFGVHETSLTNGTEAITSTLANFQAQTGTITLHGTPLTAVTAAMRANPTLSSVEVQALVAGQTAPIFSGSQALSANDTTATIALNLPVTPRAFKPSVIVPAGGVKIGAWLTSLSATSAIVELDGPIPGSGYSLAWTGISGASASFIVKTYDVPNGVNTLTLDGFDLDAPPSAIEFNITVPAGQLKFSAWEISGTRTADAVDVEFDAITTNSASKITAVLYL